MEKDRSLEKGKKLKPNWLKSLSSSSRHSRKTSSNKENTQNQNNNSDDSDSSADFVNRMSNSRSTTNKHTTNVLESIVRHFNLKFLSRSAAEYQNRENIRRNHTATSASTASSQQTNGHLSHLMNHENLAISNDYVEVPAPAARSMPIDMRHSNYLNELAGINLNSLDVNRRSPMSPWELHPTNQNEMAMLNARILMTK